MHEVGLCVEAHTPGPELIGEPGPGQERKKLDVAGSLIPPPLSLYTIVLLLLQKHSSLPVCSALCCAVPSVLPSTRLSLSHWKKASRTLARRRSFGLGTLAPGCCYVPRWDTQAGRGRIGCSSTKLSCGS